MGGSKQTTTQQQHTQNSLPDWLTGPAQQNINWAQNFNGPLTPGFNQDQLNLFNQARNFAGQGSALPGMLNPINSQIQGVVDQGAPQLGGWAGPQAMTAQGNVSAQNVDPATAAQFMTAYRNPYEQQVVDTTLAGYDVGTDRAANQMRGQRDAGAAFGDRPAIADAVFASDSARNRAATEAAIRSQGFQLAGQLGSGDAGRSLQAGLSNQAAAMQAQLANLQNSQFNAGAQNQMNAFNAGIGNQRDLANMDASQRGQAINLQGLGMLGNNAITANDASETRGLQNLATLAGIGDTQYAQQAAQNMDPLTLNALRMGNIGALAPFFGQSTMDGTTVTKTNPGVGGALGAIGGLAGGIGMLGLGAGPGGLASMFSGMLGQRPGANAFNSIMG